MTASTANARTASAAATYAIDPTHASAQFRVRHLLVSHVRGVLGEVSGEVILEGSDLARSSVVARIDAAGIDTHDSQRDAHLRSADFLDVANHPSVEFRSTAVRPVGPDRLAVEGALTIRGVTRPATLEAEISGEIRDPWGHVKRGVFATARLDRRDFGLTWNAAMEAGGLVVGDDVHVTIEAELVRTA